MLSKGKGAYGNMQGGFASFVEQKHVFDMELQDKRFRNSSKKEVFEGKCSKKQCPRHFRQQNGPKMAAAAVKVEPRSAQSEPKGAQRTPKGARREPKGRQKGTQGRPKCIQISMSENCPKKVSLISSFMIHCGGHFGNQIASKTN